MKKSIDKIISSRSQADRVVSAARRQFFTHGFRAVSMDDIAAELGMSKKTLYAHFPSKTVLVQAIMQEKFDEVEADLSRLKTKAGRSVEATLRNLLDCVQQHTAEIQPPFVRDIGRELPELFQVIEQRRRDLIRRHFGELFEEGRKAGVIRSDIPVHLIIEILLGAVQTIMNPPKLAELGLTIETGYSSIIGIILEGARSNRRNR
ncbi:MAG: TetR/AcrR family transcriptional regulator [Nitrospira sp. LK70]|nr:TetR/AcrR family transcriptional regulator [Nitrospira sp. LK70]